MSARTPFVPVAKQDSRAISAKEQTQSLNQLATNNVFSPDSSNPLHAASHKPPPKAQETTNNPQTLTSKASGNISNVTSNQRPLNIGGLVKKSSKNPPAQGQFQNQNASRRPSFAENPTIRPGTADPHSKFQQNQVQNHRQSNHNHQLANVVAPIPHQAPSPMLSTAQASGMFSSSGFKTPSLPQNAPADKANDAHTSTSALGFSFAKPKATPELQHVGQLPSPPTSIRISSTRTFEPNAVINLDQEMPSFSLNTSLPNQAGPQRVLINPDGNRSNMNVASEQDSQRGNQNQLKRPRADHEQVHGGLDVSDAKRYKNLTGGYNAGSQGISSPINPSSPNQPPYSRYHQSRSPEVIANTPQSHRQNRVPLTPPDHQHAYQHQDDQDNLNDGPSVLDKLLGRDTDAYIEEHMDKYERATDRWRDCAMEDWVAGADELAGRYGKILDFVKSHMTAKMKLFASFDAKVDAHNTILDEREKLLDGVKERLVHESGNVLGRDRSH